MSEARVALVTGASRGIGAGIAQRLHDDGFHVVGTATSEAGCGVIRDALGSERAQAECLQLADPDAVPQLFETLKATCGPPLILVNNAGITADNLALRMSDEDWQRILDVNLTGVQRLTKAALRAMMKARFGRIVNLSSVVARMGNPGQSNYVAAKAALEGYSRALALELASRNITVNAVAPGFIATDMTEELTEEQRQQMTARIPLGRTGSVAEVAAAVAYLCSEEAGYVTGATLPVNGGLHMY